MNGAELLLELWAAAGVERVFGNPGTTELPLCDALAGQSRINYVLGLHETAVMAMADGYAMAGRRLAVVNLHASCGLGNALGGLYNAWREGTPLLVTAGQQDRRLRLEEPILWGPLVDVARPWTKWAYEVERAAELPTAVRRAVQTALTPPTGPVFLSLPIDVQQEAADGVERSPSVLPDPRVRPAERAIQAAAERLIAAQRPAIVAGSRVQERDAEAALVAVAERLGAPVFSESGATHGRLPFPPGHGLYAQALPLWSPEVRDRLAEFDVVLAVGVDLLRQYVYHEPARAIPDTARLVQLDEDPWQLGKNYPVEVGVLGHLGESLAALAAELRRLETPEQTARAQARTIEWSNRHAAARAALRQHIDSQREARPLRPAVFMEAIARAVTPDTAVIEEAVTTTGGLLERLAAAPRADGYFGHRGWALGWGMGCAVGVRLAWPDRPVLALIGDGAAGYGMQALWSAARYRTPVVFVVCNNAQYQILKVGARGMELPAALADRYEGFDLVEPEVDFVGLAESLGVAARRIVEPDELTAAVSAGLTGSAPLLIDVPLDRAPPDRLAY